MVCVVIVIVCAFGTTFYMSMLTIYLLVFYGYCLADPRSVFDHPLNMLN